MQQARFDGRDGCSSSMAEAPGDCYYNLKYSWWWWNYQYSDHLDRDDARPDIWKINDILYEQMCHDYSGTAKALARRYWKRCVVLHFQMFVNVIYIYCVTHIIFHENIPYQDFLVSVEA